MTTHSIQQSIKWHKQTLVEVFSLTPVWLYLVPVLFIVVLLGLDQTAMSVYLTKEYAETAAPVILFTALALSLWAIKNNPHPYFKWQALFALILFFREWHFYGTDNGFYIGFLLLMWWASRYREKLMPYFHSKAVVSLLVLMIWTYLISKTFDRHYWDSLLPSPNTSHLFEENLELIGHLLFFYLVIMSQKLKLNT